MAAINDAALLLAAQLRALDDSQLKELLRNRTVRSNSINDFFDLSEALLQSNSLEHALRECDRPTLAILAVIAESDSLALDEIASTVGTFGRDLCEVQQRLDKLVALALLLRQDDKYSAPEALETHLASWPLSGLPSRSELVEAPAPRTLTPVEASERDTINRIAAEIAFTTTNEVTELLNQLRAAPVRDLARGGVSLPDSKRLALSMAVPLERITGLVDIANRAGLIATREAQWMPTTHASDWMSRSAADRWIALAQAWEQQLPEEIRTILSDRTHSYWDDGLEEYVRWLFPAGVEWMLDKLRLYARDAHLLGITAQRLPSCAGIALLTRTPEEAAAVMEGLFPREVHQVYVQPDLTVISPGPLAPQLDSRLRIIADVETRALASTYRISPSSLHHAMTLGETKESISGFLAELSLTGVPQPVEYLLAEAATRYGLIRVGAQNTEGSYVRSTDPVLLQSVAIDPNLSPFGLQLREGRLVSRFALEQLFWALSDARYPVAAENAEGTILSLRREQLSSVASEEAENPTSDELLVRLRAGLGGDTGDEDQAWLSRQIEVAIRNKVLLRVVVTLPDGRNAEYTLEPSSVAAGRMRALDRGADIERTLPLASIVSVETTAES